MSTVETSSLWLQEALNTHSAGVSLAHSLYSYPLDVWLVGPLGAGKTTFMQGFAEGLGIHNPLVSPTYALEQRYTTRSGQELLHIDLYRLGAAHARELIAATDDHQGIRCIEWPERLEIDHTPHPRIVIELSEQQQGRTARVTWEDIAIPSPELIRQWQDELLLPPHIQDHCMTVASLALAYADHLLHRGILVRKTALERAALVHDLLRFIDFHPNAKPVGVEYPAGSDAVWGPLRAQCAGMNHEEACAVWLRTRGFPAIADIVRVHGLHIPPSTPRSTVEQKLLYYADKRVALDTVVSLKERFADFARRYGITDTQEQWHNEVLRIEAELFPGGPPC